MCSFDQNKNTKDERSYQPESTKEEPPEIANFSYPFGLPLYILNYFGLGLCAHASIFYYFFYLLPVGVVSVWTFPVGEKTKDELQ